MVSYITPLCENSNCIATPFFKPNAANHRQTKDAERGTSGAAFGCPSAFALLGYQGARGCSLEIYCTIA